MIESLISNPIQVWEWDQMVPSKDPSSAITDPLFDKESPANPIDKGLLPGKKASGKSEFRKLLVV